jgi:hypothetical protein
MTKFNAFSIRDNFIAAVCTILLSTTLLLSASGVVQAAEPQQPAPQHVMPLA